jgi:tRNA(Ile)-lysidine synthase
MLDRFKAFILTYGMPEPPSQILAMVSGGADSMVLLHLLQHAGYSIHVLHVNYGLRGNESDMDQQLLESYCQRQGLECKVIRCSPGQLIGNIQTAARELRYREAEAWMNEAGFDAIATGHQLDDALETCWLNLIRGTGIEGLKGIAPYSGRKMRPLLWATADEVRAFAKSQGIPWREDQSNSSDAYRRNVLRNQILPQLKTWNPKWAEGFAQTLDKLQTTAELQRVHINRIRQQLLHEDDSTSHLKISVLELAGSGINETTMGWLLMPLGFSEAQGRRVFSLPQGENGKKIIGETHTASLQMPFIFITENVEEPNWEWKGSVQELLEGAVHGIAAEVRNAAELSPDPKRCSVGIRSLNDQVCIRPWKAGDRIYFGRGHKNVSDVINEASVLNPLKSMVYVVEMEGDVVWVQGIRKAPLRQDEGEMYLDLHWNIHPHHSDI